MPQGCRKANRPSPVFRNKGLRSREIHRESRVRKVSLAIRGAVLVRDRGGREQHLADIRELKSYYSESASTINEVRDSADQLTEASTHLSDTSDRNNEKMKTQTNEAEAALGRIRHEVGAINDMNAQIASTAEQQSAAAEQVNRNITSIRDAASEAAGVSDEVAKSSHDLAGVADALTAKVRFFRTSP